MKLIHLLKKNTSFHRATAAISIVFALALADTSVQLAHAAPSQAGYDPAFLPIAPSDLQQGIEAHTHDAVALYQLVRRAANQKQLELAYVTLQRMKDQQPNNAVVQAAFCFAWQVAIGDYAQPGEVVGFSDGRHISSDEYTASLDRAKRINPKLWLIYDVEGRMLVLDPKQDRHGIALLQKAESLAPGLSVTHYLLGWAYSVYDTPYHSFPKAAGELQTALTLKPVLANAALSLFNIYDVCIPDPEKAREAKQAVLLTLPPRIKLSEEGQRRLAKYKN